MDRLLCRLVLLLPFVPIVTEQFDRVLGSVGAVAA
ncbi:hypothetical protein DM75_2983 [Burkholderia mallei]|nr:hypothetical protein DM75_2983 [Burkholderia mallei]